MGLMDLFSKSESKEKQNKEEEDNNLLVSDFVELESQDETKDESEDETDKNCENDETLVNHHESLESQKPVKERNYKNRESYSDQNVWRDVKSIEDKVDNLHIDRAVKKRNDLDKKVDGILKKKK